MKLFRLHPITRKRLRRFREVRYAFWSFVILAVLYVLSLGAELMCNDRPLYLRCNGKNYFPVFKFYSEDALVGNGVKTRPDYKKIRQYPAFAENDANFMVFPLVPYGPHETVAAEDIELPEEVRVSIVPKPQVAIAYLTEDWTLEKVRGKIGETSFPVGENLLDVLKVSPVLKRAVALRFANRPGAEFEETVTALDGQKLQARLVEFTPQDGVRETTRLYLQELMGIEVQDLMVANGSWQGDVSFVDSLPESVQEELLQTAQRRLSEDVSPVRFERDGRRYEAVFDYETVSFPFRPCNGHPMGLDNAGRDVLSRMVYSMRIAFSFGLLLVVATMVTGTLLGALQGFYAGVVDIVGQRMIEIWQAIPFLYVLILMGSVFGTSFGLLLVVYALFNWIGISYYMRAEFLRLRKQPFVEAAYSQGIPTRGLIFKHILPNALTPIITFFPFSLVGAIGTLAALDFLGFGMPPGTPSWGEMLSQAQELPSAWWLILYPFLALFLVTLLVVFIGEGLRNAFDPRQFNRLEG
jgi:microcin C transport system permease protein